MNILVTGGNGQLGSSLKRRVSESGTSNRYMFTDIAELDITDSEAVEKTVRENNIGCIINCAAYTNVDKAESDFALAEKLNAGAAGILAKEMKAVGGTLIHVSTDYVFGGNTGNTPRGEDEPANPTGVYGVTKLHGEEAVKDSGCKAIILRTAWLYSEYGRNFVKTMLNLTATRPELKVVFDQAGTPTYAQDLADTIFHIIENEKMDGNEGIYHYSNEGVCSWYDFATMIAGLSGHTGCRISPCHSDEFPSPVVRPSYSVLDKTKIKDTFGIEIPYWVDSLKKCLSNINGQPAIKTDQI